MSAAMALRRLLTGGLTALALVCAATAAFAEHAARRPLQAPPRHPAGDPDPRRCPGSRRRPCRPGAAWRSVAAAAPAATPSSAPIPVVAAPAKPKRSRRPRPRSKPRCRAIPTPTLDARHGRPDGQRRRSLCGDRRRRRLADRSRATQFPFQGAGGRRLAPSPGDRGRSRSPRR